MTRCDSGVWATTQMFGMTATEFVVLNNADRDALHEPWRVRSVFARCAFELQENDEVRVMLFGLGNRAVVLTFEHLLCCAYRSLYPTPRPRVGVRTFKHLPPRRC